MLPWDCHVGWTLPADLDASHLSQTGAEHMQGAAQSPGTLPEQGSTKDLQNGWVKGCLGMVDARCENPDLFSGGGSESLCVCCACHDTGVTIDDLKFDDCDVEHSCAVTEPEGAAEYDTPCCWKCGKSAPAACASVGDIARESDPNGLTEGCLSSCQDGVCPCRRVREGRSLSHRVVKGDLGNMHQCLSSVCGSSLRTDENQKVAPDNPSGKCDGADIVPDQRSQIQSPREMNNSNNNADTEHRSSDNEHPDRGRSSGSNASHQPHPSLSAVQPLEAGTPFDPMEQTQGGEGYTATGLGSGEVVGEAQSPTLGYPEGGGVDGPSDLVTPPSGQSLDVASSMECVDSADLLSAMSLNPHQPELSDSLDRDEDSVSLLSLIQGRSEPRSAEPTYPDGALVMTVDLMEVPDEVMLRVFSYLSPEELCGHVTGVCKSWHRLAYDHSLWRRLDVSHFRVSGFQLCQIVRRTTGAIRHLDMAGTDHLTAAEMAVVAESCPDLTELDVGFVDDLNSTMVHAVLTSCPRLEFLNVEGCRHANNEMMRVLAACAGPRLQRLNFSHCSLVDESLWLMMQHLRGVTHLNIDGISWISELVVQHLAAEYRSSLESWELDGNELTDSSIEAVSTCGQLKVLSISFCELLTDLSLRHLKRLERLEKLCLRKGPSLSAPALTDFLTSPTLAHLSHLDLTECQQLDDQGVQAIAHVCGQKLKTLYLSWCWDITDRGMEHIASACRCMVNMYLVGLHRLVALWLTTAVHTMTSLRFISFEQCNEVVDGVIEEAVREKHDLVIVNYYGEMFMHNAILQ